jgi:hypothetical protein
MVSTTGFGRSFQEAGNDQKKNLVFLSSKNRQEQKKPIKTKDLTQG